MIVRYLGFDLVPINFPHGRRWLVAVPYGRLVGYGSSLNRAKSIARGTVLL